MLPKPGVGLYRVLSPLIPAFPASQAWNGLHENALSKRMRKLSQEFERSWSKAELRSMRCTMEFLPSQCPPPRLLPLLVLSQERSPWQIPAFPPRNHP